jgi:hypothetical protein
VFGFPLVSLLPFITNSYGPIHNSLCSFQGDQNYEATLWFGGFIAWSTITGFFCVLILLITVIRVFRSDTVMGLKLFKSIGFYAFATLLLWLPRFYFNVVGYKNYDNMIYAYFLIFISGMTYVLIFLNEKASLRLFEEAFRGPESELDDESYSWDCDDLEGAERQTLSRNDKSSRDPSRDSRGSGSGLKNPILSAAAVYDRPIGVEKL